MINEFLETFVITFKALSSLAFLFIICVAGARLYITAYDYIDKRFIKSKFRNYYFYHVIASIIIVVGLVIGISLLITILNVGVNYVISVLR